MREIERGRTMGFPATWGKEKNNLGSSSSTSSGMGFLFLVFPENETSAAAADSKKTNHPMTLLFPSPPSFNALLRRYSISSGTIISTVQSTISVCALLIFLTLLLFTLCFDPAALNSPHFPPRRQLSSYKPIKASRQIAVSNNLSFHHALQGMGSLYSRGTRAMNDLIVAHAVESLTPLELRLFLRLLFRSGLSSKSDLLLVFRSKSPAFDRVVVEENDSFLKLVLGRGDRSSKAILDVTQFKISEKKKKESGEPIWGRKIKRNSSEGNATESTRMSYGSVVGFDADELDPENSLAGFLDHVPMSLRRWACYPMLLGRVRRNFKHVTLVNVKEILLLGDPLGRVKNRTPESVYLTALTQSPPTRHVKNSDQKWVHPGIVAGGTRGVRRLSNAMLTEIVRAAMQRKKKNPVTESGVMNQLVRNEFALRNVNLMVSSESIPRLSSLTGLNSKPGASFLPIVSKIALARPGNSNGDGSLVILKHLCSLSLDSQVYPDC